MLISAYACEPGKGSEQGVGWNWVIQLAALGELTVITRANNRKAIESELPAHLRDRIQFEFYDLPPWLARFKRKEKGLYLYYLLWQWGAYIRARELVRQTRFSYAIHLTFGSVWMPTFLHRLRIPFIWGPVGGGEAVPLQLIRTLPFRSRFVQWLRYALIATTSINPLVTRPARAARAVLVRTGDTACVIPARYAKRTKVVLETAVSEDLLARVISTTAIPSDGSMRIVYTGRLIDLKNVSMAITAVAKAKAAGVQLQFVVVGDGPSRVYLEQQAAALGLTGQVSFRGSVNHSEVLAELRQSDVYVFPSLKEGGVWSLMEAMSAGLAIVCLKTSGMAIITDDSSAVRVEPTSAEAVIDGFAQALVRFARAPEFRRAMGENARKRIEQHFRWEHKARFMEELFDELERSSG
jgi:glycosyltransferase involved in cell wall biosynthesis